MILKNKKINILEKSINKLSKTLEEGNYLEWSYILRKQKRNYKKKFNCWNFQRNWYWYWGYNYNSNTCYCIAKNRNS